MDLTSENPTLILCEILANSELSNFGTGRNIMDLSMYSTAHIFKIHSVHFHLLFYISIPFSFFLYFNFRLKALCIHISFEALNVHSAFGNAIISHSKSSIGDGNAAVDIAADVLISIENIC